MVLDYGDKMIYKIDMSFDPPRGTGGDQNGTEDAYVHVTFESSSKKCLEWLVDVVRTANDSDIQNSLFMTYPIEEFKDEA